MARQANILSFDEAKRDIGAYRPSVVSPDSPSFYSSGDIAAFESPFRRGAGRSAARGAASSRRPVSASLAGAERRAGSMLSADPARRSAPSPRRVASPWDAGAARVDLGRASQRSAAPRYVPPAPSRVGAHARPYAEGSRAVFADEGPRRAPSRRGAVESSARPFSSDRRAAAGDLRADEPDTDEQRSGQRPSRFEAFKRSRAKDKAERAFMKQFGGSNPAADASAAGPRAAVYKGEMGVKHRQAARMQNEASGRPAKRFGFSLGGLLSFGKSPKFIASAAVAACLVLSCAFLYPAAQQYYHAVRENDRLQAEYAALADRNAALESDVGSLQTKAGVEARAHEQMGWVKEGEQTATVRGLDLDDEANSASSFKANITSDSIEAPETWYSPVLDALFGVE